MGNPAEKTTVAGLANTFKNPPRSQYRKITEPADRATLGFSWVVPLPIGPFLRPRLFCPMNRAFASQRPILVLLAEDDPRDAELFQAAIHRADVPLEIRQVSDGQEAIYYLRGVGPMLIVHSILSRMSSFSILKCLAWMACASSIGSANIRIAPNSPSSC